MTAIESRHTVKLRGVGRTEVTASGVADAEASVVKELGRILPHATVDVQEIQRGDGPARLVEDFRISYRVRLETTVAGTTPGGAARTALADARARVKGTRFERVSWESAPNPSD